MGIYRYEAVNLAGEMVRGEMDAVNGNAVVEHLHRLGYMPLVAAEKSDAGLRDLLARLAIDRDQLAPRDLVFLTRELATMLEAGLSLEKALTMLVAVTRKPKTVTFLNGVLARVRGGSGLAAALAAQDVKLPRAYIGMVQAGEAGGGQMLHATLARVGEYLGRIQALRDNIASALLYPIILLAMAALSIAVMLIYVLPQFEPLFQSAGTVLPLSTRIVVTVGDTLRDYGLVILLALALGVFALRRYLAREDIALRLDTSLISLPMIGTIIGKLETARFCRTLGMLQTNGVPSRRRWRSRVKTSSTGTLAVLSNASLCVSAKAALCRLSLRKRSCFRRLPCR